MVAHKHLWEPVDLAPDDDHVHERIDLPHWQRTFPLDDMRAIARDFFRANPEKLRADEPIDLDTFDVLGHLWPVGADIVGPYELVIMEQRRAELFPDGPPGPRVAVDIFALADGEPAHRAATKIGGLPYWPAARPWPHTLDGRPMTFVCQFCFIDSFDLVGDDLPGDVLLLFVDRDGFYQPRREEKTGAVIPSVECVWLALGERDLIEKGDIPETDWRIRPLYGVIHRTWDYPEVDEYAASGALPDGVDWTGLGVLHAVKIGGVPLWFGPAPATDARYLATSTTVLPLDGMPYPFVNVLDALPPSTRPTELLEWRNDGQLSLFWQPSDSPTAADDDHGVTSFYWDYPVDL